MEKVDIVNGNTPWLREYDILGIPHTLEPYPREPIHHSLEVAAEKYPHMGLVQFDFEMPYPVVLQNARRLARNFYDLGVRKGDRVITILPTCIQFVLVDFALSICGGVHVPCNHLDSAETLKKKCSEVSPQVLVCLDEYGSLGAALSDDLQIDHIIFTSLHDYSVCTPKKIRGTGRELWLVELIARTYQEPPRVEIDPENDIETILFTGGTTGVSKGCMLSHYNIYANVTQIAWAMGITSRLLDGTILIHFGVPLSHSYGHHLMHLSVAVGYKVIFVPDPRDYSAMAEVTREYRPSMQVGVPAQYMKLSGAHKNSRGVLGLSGSAALFDSTREEFESKRGGGIIEGYGLSEMSPATHTNASLIVRLLGGDKMATLFSRVLGKPKIQSMANGMLRRFGSKNFGRAVQKMLPIAMKFSGKISRGENKRSTIGLPLPDTSVKILDVDTGRVLSWSELVADGRSGELCVNGPQRMVGYWPDKGSGLDDEGFVHTGDVVEVDERGYFKIVDRIKDMVVVSGYKVYSQEIDQLLHTHPDIEMAATVGVPDPDSPGTERVAVFVQIKSHARARLDEEKIVGFLRDKVAKYAVPKYVRFLETIPLTELQKVDKKRLRDMIMKDLNLDDQKREVIKPAPLHTQSLP